MRPWLERLAPGHGPARPLRRAHAHRAERPGRLHADAGRAARRARPASRRAASCSRCTSPTATGPPTTPPWPRPPRTRTGSSRSAASTRTTARWPRRGARSTPARAGSSCTRAPSSSAWTSRRSPSSWRSRGERRVPVLIHAGRGIPALGENTVRLAERHPDAHADPRPRRDLRPRLAVARAAVAPERADRHGVVEPGRPRRPVRARARRRTSSGRSDSPYGRPLHSVVLALRCALQAGLHARRSSAPIAGGTLDARARGRARPRTSARRPGGPRAPLDPAARARRHASRAAPSRALAAGTDPTESRRARPPRLRGRHRRRRSRPCFAAVLEALDRYEAELAPPPPGRALPGRDAPPGPRAHDRAHARRAAPGAARRARADARRGRVLSAGRAPF